MLIIFLIAIYLVSLFVYSQQTVRKTNNDAFFRGERRSPWYKVAFGMVGASISGVTFVSVPGMVMTQNMYYLQTCLGFIFGYVIVAYVLLPVYYKLNLTSIYTFLGRRLGRSSYLTGTVFFIMSKLISTALKFYVVCALLQNFVFDAYGIPLYVNIVIFAIVIWLYTRRGGISTLVRTDILQTSCMYVALILIIFFVVRQIDMPMTEILDRVVSDSHSRMFLFDDFSSPFNFFKQFLSGIFIVIVMTGLDQDMMQKNLTCRTLRDAQKNMCVYGMAFFPVNMLFLVLGVLLLMLSSQLGNVLPASGDELLPMYAATGQLGQLVVILFVLGVVASSFSTADSALTALTTSLCNDVLRKDTDVRLRKIIHAVVVTVFALTIMLFDNVHSSSIIDLIYKLVGYTYGPLLGLFAFALFTKRHPRERFVLPLCLLAPMICYVLSAVMKDLYDYTFGYELLMLNGLLTFVGLYMFSKPTEILNVVNKG